MRFYWIFAGLDAHWEHRSEELAGIGSRFYVKKDHFCRGFFGTNVVFE